MEVNHISIGMTAPDFTAQTTFGPVKMSDYKGKWVVFFSHPGDFTPVIMTNIRTKKIRLPKQPANLCKLLKYLLVCRNYNLYTP